MTTTGLRLEAHVRDHSAGNRARLGRLRPAIAGPIRGRSDTSTPLRVRAAQQLDADARGDDGCTPYVNFAIQPGTRSADSDPTSRPRRRAPLQARRLWPLRPATPKGCRTSVRAPASPEREARCARPATCSEPMRGFAARGRQPSFARRHALEPGPVGTWRGQGGPHRPPPEPHTTAHVSVVVVSTTRISRPSGFGRSDHVTGPMRSAPRRASAPGFERGAVTRTRRRWPLPPVTPASASSTRKRWPR